MRNIVHKALRGVIPEKIEIDITVPEREELGDYSTNVAFELGKLRKTAPLSVAEDIRKKIEASDAAKQFSKIEVAKPGFVNFRLNPTLFHKELAAILERNASYGILPAHSKKKVQVEFISANPTGPLTLANGRGGFLGDVIANVLEAAGHIVEREYYVNDTGNQIITLGKSMLAARGVIPDEETFYKGEYIKKWADAHNETVTKLKGDPAALGHAAAEDFLEAIKVVVEGKAGILFGRYTSERNDVHEKGYAQKVLKLLESKNIVYEKDGAIWLKTTEYGDDKDRVLITSDKNPTYFLADAGHYLETVERGFTTKINILGPDHYGYVARIQAAAKLVGLADSTVVITQAVRLMKDGEEFKMSKRKGTFVTFNELVEEVPVDAARFFFLMVSPDSHMDFDLGLAKEQSMKNPVFYVQYGYVRALSIMKKAGVTVTDAYDASLLSTREDMRLIRKLAQYPEIIADTALDYHVHRLTHYATELAGIFHDWYEKERVIEEAGQIKSARIALVWATSIVFRNLFSMLGISAPEKM